MTIKELQRWGVTDVLEIGPGAGVLTRPLLNAGFKVTAVEKDARFAESLRAACGAFDEQTLDVVCEDFLTFRMDHWLAAKTKSGGKLAIVGNIPYFISTQIVEIALKNMPSLAVVVLLTQFEFAERMCSPKGNKTYGSLSVFAQLRSAPNLLAKVERGLFQPVPNVDSALISFQRRETDIAPDVLRKTEQLSRMAFAQRRKVLSNALKAEVGKLSSLEGFPVDLSLRADAIGPADYLAMADFLLGV
jgi:16S rRNA (adenine1518-N6/adenine1519-N6)-dimethyltransferase